MAINYGEVQRIRFAGRDAEFRPMLDASKKPTRYPVSLDDRSMLNAVIGEMRYAGGQPRAVVMGERAGRVRVTKDAWLKEEARQDGHPNRRFLQLYMKTDSRTVGGETVQGGIFELPVTDGREADDVVGSRDFDGQTVNYLVTNEATGEKVDLYLQKGWRYATCDDVVAVWQRAESNGKRAAEEKRLASPVAVLESFSKMLVKQADKSTEKGA